MPYKEFKLPEYPCKEDMWDKLSRETRPILIYGMGNGADKLINRFEKLNIKYADIFASDGFVRGHSFRGVRVKSFSEIRDMYPDFVIVLSFASNRCDVIEMLIKMNDKYDMYIPDMPVAGEEYFDRNFFNSNYDKIKAAYEIFSDEKSKNAFAAVINYKLSGKMDYLISAYSEREELYELIKSYKKIESIADCGAYNGDTVKEAKKYMKELRSALAIEPDPKNYKRLLKYADSEEEISIKPINAALWCEAKCGEIQSSGNRNSSVSATASHEYKSTDVPLITLDSLNFAPDYIKYDVEGAEMEALIGSSSTIFLHAPVLLVSIYHRSADIFTIVLYLAKNYKNYDFYIRRLLSVPAWELDLIAIPKKC